MRQARQERQGTEWQGLVRSGAERAGEVWQAWPGEARRCREWHGMVRQARSGKAWQGSERQGRHGKQILRGSL